MVVLNEKMDNPSTLALRGAENVLNKYKISIHPTRNSEHGIAVVIQGVEYFLVDIDDNSSDPEFPRQLDSVRLVKADTYRND